MPPDQLLIVGDYVLIVARSLIQVSIWKTLQHPNVLELLGASSASSDPPWFFVSPYYKNGSLVTYLKSLPSLDSVDLLKMIHEIAKGMAYLHSKDVLHGDLKVRASAIYWRFCTSAEPDVYDRLRMCWLATGIIVSSRTLGRAR